MTEEEWTIKFHALQQDMKPLVLAKTRYDKVRRMHPISWLRIYNDALMGKGTFDELVDKWKGDP